MAATVTDLISTTITTLESATRHYSVVKDDKNLREAFHGAGAGLFCVKPALEAANTQLAGGNLTGGLERTRNLLETCNNNAKLSESIFRAVAQAPETSRFEHYRAAVKQEGQGRLVEVLMTGVMNDVCALAENFAIQDQVGRLHEAIKKLSEMEPSLPKEESGHNFTHFGTGDQYNAPSGTQNINKGSGHQVTGGTFSGPVTFGSPPPAPNPPIQR